MAGKGKARKEEKTGSMKKSKKARNLFAGEQRGDGCDQPPSRRAGGARRPDAAQHREISLTQRAMPAKGSEQGRKHQAGEEAWR